MEKFYITTPIYYVNDKPHLGHAYTTIATDVLARHFRQQGSKVFFLTGTDEHGEKIAQSADKQKKAPLEFCNEQAERFINAWKTLNISYDNFIRTTDDKHIKAVRKTLETLKAKEFIYKGDYEGLYCVGCERFKTENDLEDGKCPEHNLVPELIKEHGYFFKMSVFQDRLIELIETDEYQIAPSERKNEVLSFLKNNDLRDLYISRPNVKWGVELPFDKNYTTYVWVDAFLNYLTGLGWDGDVSTLKSQHSNPNTQIPTLTYWPPDLQLMSKDILRVHATIWPALLLALDIPLPKKLFIHGFFTIDNKKMSKSLGNVLDPVELSKKYGADAVRYFVLREIVFGQDGDISIKRLEERYTSDLANDLGNLVSRVSNMAEKFLAGKINANIESPCQFNKVNKYLENLKFHLALEEIWKAIIWANKYIDENKPWELAKNEEKKEELKKIISELVATIIIVGEKLCPFMPETSQKILEQFKNDKIKIAPSLFPKNNL